MLVQPKDETSSGGYEQPASTYETVIRANKALHSGTVTTDRGHKLK